MRPPRLSACAAFLLLAACSPAAAPQLYSRNADQLMGVGPAPAPVTAPMPGYLFIAPLKSRFSYLLDAEGKEVHQWESAWFPGAGTELESDGSILRCGRILNHPSFTAGGQGGHILRIAWDGTLLWDYEYSSDKHLHHHDATLLPNGNVMFCAWEKRTKAEVLARGRDPELQKDEEFWPDSIIEVRPEGLNGGTIVWEWHAWDHMIQDFDPALALYGDVAKNPQLIDVNGDRPRVDKTAAEKEAEAKQMAELGYAGDAPPPPPPPPAGAPPDGPPPGGRPGSEADWMHTNAVDYHAGLDLVVISLNHFSEIWVLDHSTTTAEAASHAGGRHGKGGDLLYRWGNPRVHHAGGDAEQQLFAQHHVQWIVDGQPGAGNFICYNNGPKRPDGDYSSIEEWRMPIAADGSIGTGPAQAAWRYVAPEKEKFFSPFISGVQRLPNGSTLITEGVSGRVLEVASDGKLLWEWQNTFGGEEEPKDDGPSAHVPPKAQFRAFKYAPDHPALAKLKQ